MEDPKINILGIDCAVQDNRIGLASGVLTGEGLEVRYAIPGSAGLSQIAQWIDLAVPTLLAIDAPLGWPIDLGRALVEHRAGQPVAIDANRLFRRRTDCEIKKRLGRQPLDVGADRIARTAHRALEILDTLARQLEQREIPLAWDAGFQGLWAIEVYPAATLTAWGIPIKGYKDKKKGASERREILRRLREHLSLPTTLDDGLVSCVDALDAVVCLLAGADFLLGRAVPPGGEQVELARKEGWIWCREQARND